MLVVVFLLLSLAASADCDNNTALAVWKDCTTILREKDQLKPENVRIGAVLGHCHLLRKTVAKCVSDGLRRSRDDGSTAARGRVLVELIAESDREPEVVRLTRYYHYACVYNDIGLWLRNASCYHYMLQTCVLRDGDCYGLKCRQTEEELVYKSRRGAGGLLLWSPLLLTILY